MSDSSSTHEIVQDARARHPEVPSPRWNGTLVMDFADDMSSDEDAVEVEEDREAEDDDGD
ncbi:hypothetical protein TRAPUB_12465 [Trametes pubescens]|uniref:Uncharacterized protein n=1 Tax=Trametes pubescens TaxID=154538 RepID=A0A1M2VTS9_TRAPU|nr:hypothetical protein TRAPUB_12465 [Trametes pubescens]